MVQEANMAHMRYEADLIADEVTQQIDHRFQALERLSDILGVSNAPDWPAVAGRVSLETAELEYYKILQGTRRPYVSEPFVGWASEMPMVLSPMHRYGQ